MLLQEYVLLRTDRIEFIKSDIVLFVHNENQYDAIFY